MKRIKKGDEVIIISGRNKGNTGNVAKVLGDRVIVTGQNMKTKNIKPNPTTGETGGRIQKEGYIHISNIMLLEDGKGVKTGFRIEDGKKQRYSKKSNKVI